ncbi:uncharacterized protein LOC135210859 isoform X2 [Macrobrachium nipponense]|uniref:uncharacterized protein LOC135210859 isoform X2 n=1 Tax=Macrobrachium nipponense TaxID=159736 RepID=UPI0030C7CF13
MSCTKDTELMHSAFSTLKYLAEANFFEGNLFKDVLLALANLGGDISKFGKDLSTISSPVIKSSTEVYIKEKSHGLFKENKMLILRFLAVHLRSANSYSPSEVDDLLKICLAVSLDPLMLDNGYPNANDVFNVLSFYPSTERFEEVGDVLDLVREQIHVFSGETDSSLLLSVLFLIDVCINDEPLPVDQRATLQELCNTLELTIRKRRGNIDDQNTLHLNSYMNRVMVKWRQKAGSVTRQQTLMEMKGSYTSPGHSSGYKKDNTLDIE